MNKGEYPFRPTALKFQTHDLVFSGFWNYLPKYNSVSLAPDFLSDQRGCTYSISRLYYFVVWDLFFYFCCCYAPRPTSVSQGHLNMTG